MSPSTVAYADANDVMALTESLPSGEPSKISLRRVRFRLLPTDEKFFELFNDAAANAAQCARLLRDAISNDDTSAHDRIRECEHTGDDLTRTIMQRLNSTFITPFDREDIHALAEDLDDVVDDIQTVSELLVLIPVSTPLPELDEQVDVLVRAADEAEALIARLESMKDVRPHLDAIDQLESAGDAIYRRILGRLYSGEIDALEVLRWKGIVEALEGALNTIEDISDVVEAIVLKHA
jgi:predicted phosphate transport protein (TIGR00153 family)